MQQYPHVYRVGAEADTGSAVQISSEGLSPLRSMPPKEFDGPGDLWSPESLLVAAVADCFILTFRAIARASQVNWLHLDCEASGTLDRVDNVTCFTRFDIEAVLTVPAGTDDEKARRVLEKSEAVCLITNSLTAEKHLNIQIRQAGA